MDTLESRTPPHNYEAETGLLGSLLLSCGDLAEVFETLRPEHFFSRRHQIIYQAISTLYEEHGSVDTVLLRDRLEREGLLDEIGGLDFLMELTESVKTTANAHRYAEIIKDRAVLRRIIDTCSEIIKDAYGGSQEASGQLDLAEQRIFEITEHRKTSDVVPIRDAIQSTFDLIDRWAKGRTGLPTGYTDLDRMINGLQASELIVVAGRPSMGKTTLCMNIAMHAALEHKVPVAVFSLELERRQLAMNLLCSTARVSSQGLRSVSLDSREWQKVTNAADMLSETNMYIDDSPNLNAISIRAKARRLRSKYNIELLIIDYLQLMELGTGRYENRQQEITAISRALKGLARELQIPVITVSQLSRAVESREQHRPRMSDLRESGAIEQDADLILLLYREEYYHPEREEAKGKAEVIIAKQRNGPVGSVNLAFLGEHLRFENLAQYQEVF